MVDADSLVKAIDGLVDGGNTRKIRDEAEAVLMSWTDEDYRSDGIDFLTSLVEGFYTGSTPNDALLETVFFPPLKLAKFINQGAAQAYISEELHSSLTAARVVCFQWGRMNLLALGQLGTDPFIAPAEGRTKLLNVLHEAKFPEVR